MSVATDLLPQLTRIGGLHVASYGSASKPAVLFTAGLGGTGSYWLPQIDHFVADYRVILYDHRGTGMSDRSELPPGYSVGDLSADIGVVLDGLEIYHAHIVGHAAGGMAALELARSAPERVRSLTIVNGWAVADVHFRRCMEIRREIYLAGGANAYLKAQPTFLYPAAWISDHLDQLDRERVHAVPLFQDQATLFARMAALEACDMREALPDIGHPTLVIATQDDMLVPARASRELAAGLRKGSLVTLASGGHAVNVTAALDFNQRLGDFLSKVSHGLDQ